MKKLLTYPAFSIIVLMITSCNGNKKNDAIYSYMLEPSAKVAFALDSNTVAETTSLFGFITDEGVQHLGFLNRHTNSILFFNVETQQLDHQINFTREGPNSTGSVRGFTVISKDSIIVTIQGNTMLYMVDGKGAVIKRVDFTIASNKEALLWTDGYSFFYSPVISTNGKLYITQLPIRSDKICVEIDLRSDCIKRLPMVHPDRDPKNNENNMFSRDFDGKNFVYSFRNNHNIYITKDHKTVYTKLAKSDEIGKIVPVKYHGIPTREEGNIAIIEHSQYRSIIFDPYRQVYYRFAYPGVTINEGDNLEVFSKYYKKFSVIILDKDFNKIGEYFTPENIYNMRMFFLGKEGLYLSTNHVMNPEYDENRLSFELLKLKKINR